MSYGKTTWTGQIKNARDEQLRELVHVWRLLSSANEGGVPREETELLRRCARDLESILDGGSDD